jgi:hypothetical protein
MYILALIWCPIVFRPPMVFNIWSIFWRRANAETDSSKPMFLVKLAGAVVLLMRAKLQAAREPSLGELDQPCSPTFAPLGGIHIHPIDVRALHCEKGDNMFVVDSYPDIASGTNHFSKDLSGPLERERSPLREEGVRRQPRTVPHANDIRLISIVVWTNDCRDFVHSST